MLTTGQINGHRVLWLENEVLKIAVLPDKGADIYAFIHKPSGVDFLLKTPDGLKPPDGASQSTFLANYEGGWQELFPNTGTACDVQGKRMPMHGEVALLPWTVSIQSEDEPCVRFSVQCRQTPLRLERWMRLGRSATALEIEGRIVNEGTAAAACVWGHHLVLGGTFLEEGCQIEAPSCALITPDASFQDASARLAPDKQTTWPIAQGRLSGAPIDLTVVPGPQARSRDDLFLTDLPQGRIAVANPRLALQFVLEWDAALFRTIVLWHPYGATTEPLAGTYGLGIEPWVSRHNLQQAIVHGEALILAGGQSLNTTLRAGVHPWSSR